MPKKTVRSVKKTRAVRSTRKPRPHTPAVMPKSMPSLPPVAATGGAVDLDIDRLVKRLEAHALGHEKMTNSAIRAAQILLAIMHKLSQDGSKHRATMSHEDMVKLLNSVDVGTSEGGGGGDSQIL